MASGYEMRYTRPRPSTFSEVTSSPSFFFSAPAIAPRTVCDCQPVAAMISSMVAPSGARSMAIRVACLVPSRGVRTLGAASGPVGASGAGGSVCASVAPAGARFASSGSMTMAARPASVANSVTPWPSVCAHCDCGLDVRPLRQIGDELRACCPHDAAEDVVLEDGDLTRFGVDANRLAGQIGASGGLAGPVSAVLDGVWTIGSGPASGGDALAVAVVRGPAIVNRHDLVFAGTPSEGEIAAAHTALLAAGILVR